MSLSGVCQDAFRAYIALLKVSPSKGEAENWEAGQIPALPPQRWWSESLGKSHWTVPSGKAPGWSAKDGS